MPFLAHATMEPMNCTVELQADGCAQQYSRVEETFEASLTPMADVAAVVLVRLRYITQRWVVDPRFKAAHVAVLSRTTKR